MFDKLVWEKWKKWAAGCNHPQNPFEKTEKWEFILGMIIKHFPLFFKSFLNILKHLQVQENALMNVTL